jgi:hypothetical protein
MYLAILPELLFYSKFRKKTDLEKLSTGLVHKSLLYRLCDSRSFDKIKFKH